MVQVESSLTEPNDHIMANTWRLIFERNSRRSSKFPTPPKPDFSLLEQLLPEYRLIGRCLALDKNQRPN